MSVDADPIALFVHCAECSIGGEADRIAVLIIDGEMLQVVCENHSPAKPVCSVTIPEEERIQLHTFICEEEE